MRLRKRCKIGEEERVKDSMREVKEIGRGREMGKEMNREKYRTRREYEY